MTVLLGLELRRGEDLVVVRERTREVAHLAGLSGHDQATFTAAVSEVARNALRQAGGGSVEFSVQHIDCRPMITAVISDAGPGAAWVAAALAGSDVGVDREAASPLLGARRLSDAFAVTTSPPAVMLGKRLPISSRAITPDGEASIVAALAKARPTRLVDELQRQNRELLVLLETLQRRTADVERLNAELAETNRGVLALYAELDDKAESLKAASAAKSRFVSDASHELRTPLNAIISLSGLLLDRTDGDLSEEQEKQVSLIRQSAASLVELVSGMLDLAKIEAGKVDIRIAPVEVADLLAAVRGMFRPMVAPGVTLIVDEPGPMPSLATDEGKVAQILRNLVANALKFTDQGTVHVHAEAADECVQVHVSDTGIGIAPENLERIFEDFTQVTGWNPRHGAGTGLGLPVARKLARLLGGEVSVASTPGAGSVFTVTLPMAPVALPSAGQTGTSEPSIG